ncbi:unnamed protein product [Parnassius apollo]|uniref:(apollo) hypothetical protein n=1 Tax=Parnassius apollo TaxID=110799 RepID=A0A8S3X2D2_PARAO|nr:unnamed protein product [Parnassius apollo]
MTLKHKQSTVTNIWIEGDLNSSSSNESNHDESVGEKTDSTSRLGNEEEHVLPLEEKTQDEILNINEAKSVQQSFEISTQSVNSGEFKTAEENDSTITDRLTALPSDENRRSNKVSTNEDKSSLINDKNNDEISNERSITKMDDEELNADSPVTDKYLIPDIIDENTKSDDEPSSKNLNIEMKVTNEKSSEDRTDVLPDTRRSMTYDTQEALLDNKARIAGNSQENMKDPGTAVNSGLGVINTARPFGSSQRSHFGEFASPFAVATLSRPGPILSTTSVPLPNPNALLSELTRVKSQKLKPLNGYLRHTATALTNFNQQNPTQKSYDAFTSSEFKPLEEFNSNPFANAYPYAYNPTTTTTTLNPLEPEFSRSHVPTDTFSKFHPISENYGNPLIGYVADNLQSFDHVAFKSHETFIPPYIPNIHIHKPISHHPFFYHKKCFSCS